MVCADQEETANGKSRSRYRTRRSPSEQQPCPRSEDLMKELTARLEHRRQHSDVSPNVPASPVNLSRQPSYLSMKDDTSGGDDDDDDYIKPVRRFSTNHVDTAGEETTLDSDDDDDDDDDDTGYELFLPHK